MGPESQLSQIEATLREHIRSRYASGAAGPALDSEDDLLQSGVVDSMGVIHLTTFIEEHFGITVDDEDVVPDNFRSLDTMTRYIASKKGIAVEDPFVASVRSLVKSAVPEEAVVLVASHADEALLSLDGSTGWHFPRDDQGGYGHNPADDAEAIAQLETLRSLGATHIVFPEPALWWLEEYAGLGDYLESGPGEVGRSEAGVVYALPAA
jgi:acyl carrier protein